eukprot:113038_1
MKLSIKVGVGVGLVSVSYVGGQLGRMEFVATGAPLEQAFLAENKSQPGDVVLSKETWEIVKTHFIGECLSDGLVRLCGKTTKGSKSPKPLQIRRMSQRYPPEVQKELAKVLQRYLP